MNVLFTILVSSESSVLPVCVESIEGLIHVMSLTNDLDRGLVIYWRVLLIDDGHELTFAVLIKGNQSKQIFEEIKSFLSVVCR